MDSLDKAFGQAVRQRRAELNISQEALGFRASVHRTYISQLERGLKSPTLKVISVLAKALELDAYILVQNAEKIYNSANQDENDV